MIFETENEKYRLRIFHDEMPENPREWDNLATIVGRYKRYKVGDKQAENTEMYSNWEEWLENEILISNGGKDEVIYLPLYLYDHNGHTIKTYPFSCRWDSGQVGWIYCTKDRFRQETGYSENELFSKDAHREPELNERVKIKGKDEWGQVIEIKDGSLTVDFDYCRPSREKKKIITIPLLEIEEVMANKAETMLINEVEEYDSYLRNDVYKYTLEEKKSGCDAKVCINCGYTEPCESSHYVEYWEIDSCRGFYGKWAKEGMADNICPEARVLLKDFNP